MKTPVRQLLQRSLIVLSLASPGVTAQNFVLDEGVILEVNPAAINISDAQYSLLATTHVIRLPSKRKAHLKDLKPGDNVRVKLIKIAKKRFVDTIYLLSESARRDNNEEGRRRP